MNTRIFKMDSKNIDKEQLSLAAQMLKDGGTVVFPTETVYGLGANALNPLAVAKIFEAKGRPTDNPLIVHISSLEQLSLLTDEIPQSAYKVAKNLWPGAITIILKKSRIVPNIVSANLNTVAVRMPTHPIAFELIELAGVPIAAPSANISGRPSPTDGGHAIEDLFGRVDCIIDGGGSDFGIESTVVDLSEDKPVILRPGAVTIEELREILPNVVYAEGLLDKLKESQKPKSPGMKYRHYAPKAEVVAFEGDLDVVKKEIEKRLVRDKVEGVKAGVLGQNEIYENSDLTIHYQNGAMGLARVLFGALREFDANGIERIYCEPVTDEGMAIAVKNRLYKAAGYNIVKV